jgi:plastocyanin
MQDPLARLRSRWFIAGAIAVASIMLVGGAVAVAANRSVAISGFAFAPASLTINVGDRVTWRNSDSVTHTATAGAFDTGDIDPGASASVRFTKPGTYRYVCTPHPSMKGTIRVLAAGGGPTDPPTDTLAPGYSADASGAGAAVIGAAAALLLLAFLVPRLSRRRPTD